MVSDNVAGELLYFSVFAILSQPKKKVEEKYF